MVVQGRNSGHYILLLESAIRADIAICWRVRRRRRQTVKRRMILAWGACSLVIDSHHGATGRGTTI